MLTKKISEEIRLDILAKEIYGSEKGGTVEALLNANFGLAAQGGFVPAGEIQVPDAPEPEPVKTVNPWE